MKNATLIIKNGENFSNDIWQYNADFTKEQWYEVIKGFSDIISEAKKTLENIEIELEEFDELYPLIENFGDDKLYQLGDIINFFKSIDVKLDK